MSLRIGALYNVKYPAHTRHHTRSTTAWDNSLLPTGQDNCYTGYAWRAMRNLNTVIIRPNSLILLSPHGNRAISRYPADADVRPSDRWHGLTFGADTVPLRESVTTLLAGLTGPVRFIRRADVGLVQLGFGEVPGLEPGEAEPEPSKRVGNPQYAGLVRKLASARAAFYRARALKRDNGTPGRSIPLPIMEARVEACQTAIAEYMKQQHDGQARIAVDRLTSDADGLYMACRSFSRVGSRGYLPTLPPVDPVNAYNWYDARRAVGTLTVPSVKVQTVIRV